MKSPAAGTSKPRTLLAAALAALLICASGASKESAAAAAFKSRRRLPDKHNVPLSVPRGGGWFGRGNGRRRNNDGGGDDDNNNGDGGGGDKVYPALSEQEIVDVLNVPVFAITDESGNGAVLSAKPDNANVVYFFLSEQMARQALKSMQTTNQGMNLRVSALHLGKVWFKLLHNNRPRGEKVELTQVDRDAPHVFKRVQMRLVPEIRDLVGARLLQGLDPNDVPRLQDAIESGDQDAARALIRTATEKSAEFKEPFNKIPVFMVSQLRMQKKDPNGGDGYEPESMQKFPMFLSPKTMLHVYQKFVSNSPGSEDLQPTLQLGELHNIVEMMQHESEMDFRNVVLLPGGQEDDGSNGGGGGSDDSDDDDNDGGDGSIKRDESESEDLDIADIQMTPYIEMGAFVADVNGGMVPLQ